MCGRNFASFSVLYSGMYCSAMVLLDVSPEPVEQAENSFCGADGADGAHPGGACQSGVDESISRDALKSIESTTFDLAILDIMLPDIDGFRICQKIRERYFYPIIMLTAKVEDMDKIMGLTIGADDYITKPFNPLEVVARVKTQLRRYVLYNQAENVGESKEPLMEYDIRGLIINKSTHRRFFTQAFCKLDGWIFESFYLSGL